MRIVITCACNNCACGWTVNAAGKAGKASTLRKTFHPSQRTACAFQNAFLGVVAYIPSYVFAHPPTAWAIVTNFTEKAAQPHSQDPEDLWHDPDQEV